MNKIYVKPLADVVLFVNDVISDSLDNVDVHDFNRNWINGD